MESLKKEGRQPGRDFQQNMDSNLEPISDHLCYHRQISLALETVQSSSMDLKTSENAFQSCSDPKHERCISHMKDLVKHRLLNPRTSDPVGPVDRGGRKFCISDSFPDAAAVVCCMENNRNHRIQGKENCYC